MVKESIMLAYQWLFVEKSKEGLMGSFPPLKGSPIVQDTNPELLITIIYYSVKYLISPKEENTGHIITMVLD